MQTRHNEVKGDRIEPVGDDDIGLQLAGLHKLHVHRSDCVDVLIDDALSAPAAFAEVAFHFGGAAVEMAWVSGWPYLVAGMRSRGIGGGG